MLCKCSGKYIDIYFSLKITFCLKYLLLAVRVVLILMIDIILLMLLMLKKYCPMIERECLYLTFFSIICVICKVFVL